MATLTLINADCLAASEPTPGLSWYLRGLRFGDDPDTGQPLFDPDGVAYQLFADWLGQCGGGTVQVASRAVSAQPTAALLRPDFPDYTGWDGSALWDRLHRETSPSLETVEAVVAAVCPRCQPRARSLLAEIPPVFATLAEYRRWSWTYHNAVSASIGSATLTYEEAAARWGW